MPTTGAYDFKRAGKADSTGLIANEHDIGIGEWAWVDYTDRVGTETGKRYLFILMRDPDCTLLSTLWSRFGDEVKSPFTIDAHGNINPSVWHKFQIGDPPVEKCGFHTQPTRLLDFVDLR